MPSRLVRAGSVTADASGNGEVIFYPAASQDWVVTHTGLLQEAPGVADPAQPTAKAYVNGIFREGSQSASLDASDTRFVFNPGDEYKIVWTGAEPGSRLTATLNIVQYPAGTAPLE